MVTTRNHRGCSVVVFSLSVLAAACSNGPQKVDHEALTKAESMALTTTAAPGLAPAGTLNTSINSSIQIDHLNADPLDPSDANLFLGNDPADQTASRNFPTGGPATFIDWNDLGNDISNHVLYDFSSGKDSTSFPQSNECVGSSQVLSKMDLTYVAVANNQTYAYFAVQRSNNNGDAGYYWIFTKKTPTLDPNDSSCPSHSGESGLFYDISVGDVLLAGHFHPNGSPLLRVFRANTATTGVTAVNAVDFNNAMWTENTSSLAGVAVNTTITAPGAFGMQGVLAKSGTNMDTEVFAEAAVDLSLFTGGSATCGATFYGSVITRSSGSGGTSPDLKDLAGPALFNFGGVKATPTFTGKCDGTADFSVTTIGPDGQPLSNPKCSWEFDGNPQLTSSSCSGNISLGAGTHTATVTVTDGNDGGSGCSDTEGPISTTVNTGPVVHISPSSAGAMCPDIASTSVTYTATVTGGTGNPSFTWHGVSGCTGSTCTVSTLDGTYCAKIDLYVVATDAVASCGSSTSETEEYLKLTTVTATDNP